MIKLISKHVLLASLSGAAFFAFLSWLIVKKRIEVGYLSDPTLIIGYDVSWFLMGVFIYTGITVVKQKYLK